MGDRLSGESQGGRSKNDGGIIEDCFSLKPVLDIPFFLETWTASKKSGC